MLSEVMLELRSEPARAATIALGVLVCAATGLLIARGETGGLLVVIVVGALVAVGFRDGRLLLTSLFLASLLHFPIGNFRSIANIQIAEVVVPLLLVGVLLRASVRQAPPGSADPSFEARRKGRGITSSSSARWLHRAVLAYGVVIVANILRSALLLSTAHAWRPLYAYMVALAVYFLAYRALWRGSEAKSAERVRLLLSVGYVLSGLVCALGVFAVLLHLPLNLGNLRFSVYDLSSGAVRVGFLDTFGSMGLALVCAGVGERLVFRWAFCSGRPSSQAVGALRRSESRSPFWSTWSSHDGPSS